MNSAVVAAKFKNLVFPFLPQLISLVHQSLFNASSLGCKDRGAIALSDFDLLAILHTAKDQTLLEFDALQ